MIHGYISNEAAQQWNPHKWVYVFWLAVAVPLAAYIYGMTRPAPLPAMDVPEPVASQVSAVRPAPLTHREPSNIQLLRSERASPAYGSDLNALLLRALRDPDRETRVQAVEEMKQLRREWSAAMGVPASEWNVSATAPQNANKIVIAVRRDLYISSDGGLTFALQARVLPGTVNSLAIHPADENILYAGVDGLGFYQSHDGGQTWQSSNAGIQVTPGARFGVTAIAVNPRNAQNMYIAAGVWLGTGKVTYYPLGILVTRDGGQNWTRLETENTQPIQYLILDANTLHAWSNEEHTAYPAN